MKKLTYLLIVVFLGCQFPEPKDCPECPEILIDTLTCQYDLDSVIKRNLDLQLSWVMLVQMFDSVINEQPRDTVWKIPNCLLCYEKIDTIDGFLYFVGYDGSYFRLYQDNDTSFKQVFYKDTVVSSFLCPHERTVISVRAKGTICKERYPDLKVFVNNEIAHIITIDSTGYKFYEFNARFHWYDIDSIQVVYDADCYEPDVGEDRNAWVSNIRINGIDKMFQNTAKIEGFINWRAGGSNIVEMPSNGIITVYEYFPKP